MENLSRLDLGAQSEMHRDKNWGAYKELQINVKKKTSPNFSTLYNKLMKLIFIHFSCPYSLVFAHFGMIIFDEFCFIKSHKVSPFKALHFYNNKMCEPYDALWIMQRSEVHSNIAYAFSTFSTNTLNERKWLGTSVLCVRDKRSDWI